MALEKVKTEMKGTGGGRWTTRYAAKTAAKKARRAEGKKLAREGKEAHGSKA
jgi:hypothetical protein